MIFSGLIAVSFMANQFFFPASPTGVHEVFASSNSALNLSCAVALSSLTHIDGSIFNNNLPMSYLVFSLVISQISGIAILSWLLWFYWKLFGNKKEKEYARLPARQGIRKAIRLTVVISLLIESLLFLFFMYSIPVEITDYSLQKKLIAALSLAINSFNNAGFPLWQQVLDHGFLEQNFVLQIGIIGGTVLGSLGIFVIYELLSPIKLRERLNDYTIDWSFITKVSVYGTIFILILFSCIFYFIESNAYLKEKNIIESVIASIYEITSARGFGFYLADNVQYNFTSAIKLFVATVGAGPFSTGGGLTLFSLVWMYSLVWKLRGISLPRRQAGMDFIIANSIAKNLIIYSLVAFSIPTFLLFIIDSESTAYNSFMSQLELFTTNRMVLKASSDLTVDLIKSFTVIAGRIGFVIACFITLRQYKSDFSRI